MRDQKTLFISLASECLKPVRITVNETKLAADSVYLRPGVRIFVGKPGTMNSFNYDFLWVKPRKQSLYNFANKSYLYLLKGFLLGLRSEGLFYRLAVLLWGKL